MNTKTMCIGFIMSVLMLFSGCASHGTQEFYKYEGTKDKVFEASGGTRYTYDGIDFWNNGTPNRAYKLIGTLVDNRAGGAGSQKTFNEDIANKVKELGADGVILGQTSKTMSGMVYLGNGITVPAYKNASEMAVIQYIK